MWKMGTIKIEGISSLNVSLYQKKLNANNANASIHEVRTKSSVYLYTALPKLYELFSFFRYFLRIATA